MQNNFRYELKFILDENKAHNCFEWINSIGATEKYSCRTNNSIYFDDLENSSVRENLMGISQRKKIRMRWYGNDAKSLSDLKLEIKERKGRLNSKTNIPLPALSKLIHQTTISELNEKLMKCLRELNSNDTVLNQYLIPELLIRYQRLYFETRDSIRITFDKNIKFFNVISNQRLNELTPVDYRMGVMEVKILPENKDKVANFLRRTYLTPKRHSKYLVGLSVLKSVLYY